MPEGLPGKKGCLVAVAQDLDSGENGAMDKTTLFTMALGLQAPWEVKDLQFNVSLRQACVNG